MGYQKREDGTAFYMNMHYVDVAVSLRCAHVVVSVELVKHVHSHFSLTLLSYMGFTVVTSATCEAVHYAHCSGALASTSGCCVLLYRLLNMSPR